MHNLKSIAAVGTVLLGAAAALAAPAQAQHFQGKTISFVVGFPAGGALDLGARTFAEFYGKHIPGNPNVIVQNMPGAGGGKAANFVYSKGSDDGTTILFSANKVFDELVGTEGTLIKHGEMSVVALGYSKHMVFGRNDVADGMESQADIAEAQELRFAGRTPTSNLDLAGRISMSLLGADIKFIPGFFGTAKIMAALQTGEAQASTIGMADYTQNLKQNMADDGLGYFYLPSIDSDGNVLASGDAEYGDVPGVPDLYMEVHGKEIGGVEWEAVKWLRFAGFQFIAAPPGTDAAALAELREGFAATAADPEFHKAFSDRFGSVWQFIVGEPAQTLLGDLMQPDEDVFVYIKDYAGI